MKLPDRQLESLQSREWSSGDRHLVGQRQSFRLGRSQRAQKLQTASLHLRAFERAIRRLIKGCYRSLQWVETGSAPVEHKISASLPKPDIYAHNPVQDALVLTKSASSKATSVCPHLPLINSRSGFCRSSHSTAHYHFGYRSRLGFRDRGNLLRYHPLRFTLR